MLTVVEEELAKTVMIMMIMIHLGEEHNYARLIAREGLLATGFEEHDHRENSQGFFDRTHPSI